MYFLENAKQPKFGACAAKGVKIWQKSRRKNPRHKQSNASAKCRRKLPISGTVLTATLPIRMFSAVIQAHRPTTRCILCRMQMIYEPTSFGCVAQKTPAVPKHCRGSFCRYFTDLTFITLLQQRIRFRSAHLIRLFRSLRPIRKRRDVWVREAYPEATKEYPAVPFVRRISP